MAKERSIFGFDYVLGSAAAIKSPGAGDSPLTGALGLSPDQLNDLMMEAMAETGDPAAQSGTSRPELAALPRWVRDMQLAKPLRQDVRATVGERGDEGLLGQLVFMGQKEKSEQVDLSLPGASETGGGGPRELPQEPTYGTKTSTKDKVRTVDQVMSLPYTWEDDEIKSAMERMREAGLKIESFDDLTKTWAGLVKRAAMTYTATEGKKKVTPWDVLDMHASETADPEDVFTGTRRGPVVKSVSEISEGQAWSVLQSNLSQMLGRDPSDQEVRDFTYRMNQLAAKNPTIGRTIKEYKDGKLISSTDKTVEAGFGESDVLRAAYDKAQSDPEYAEYQAATTYFEAAMGALGAIGDA